MLEEILYYYGNQILSAVMCALFGLIGYAIKRAFTNWADTDEKKNVAKNAAMFVEQTWKSIHGKDKLHKALEIAETMLSKKHIKFDADEMEILIEAAVGEFNKVFAKTESLPAAHEEEPSPEV